MRVLVFGTFDGLHQGHKFVLKKAYLRGELWIVVARDKTVEKLKGKLPIQSQEKRMDAIQAICPNSHVVLGDNQDYFAPIVHIKPDLILLGYDQQLPPGIRKEDFLCPVERLKAHMPEQFKSSLLREK